MKYSATKRLEILRDSESIWDQLGSGMIFVYKQMRHNQFAWWFILVCYVGQLNSSVGRQDSIG